jgi:hypothetical protein
MAKAAHGVLEQGGGAPEELLVLLESYFAY